MPAAGPVEPFIVGATHRSSTMMLRDRLFVDEAASPAFFQQLMSAGITQAIVLSTCDRVELQGMSATPEAAIKAVLGLFATRVGQTAAGITGEVETLSGDAAARRIFAVASSLESQVIGEPQVLGQVKDGHRLAARHGMVGTELESLLQAAYSAAKRVRSETRIGERPVTLASSAVQVARDLHGDLSRCGGLVIGLGDMGDLIGSQLRSAGLGRLAMTGPSARVEAEARRTGCNFVPFDSLDGALTEADIVITSSGSGRFLVGHDAMVEALRRRKRRPVLVIDGGVPGDVDPAVDRLDGAFLYSLDDLERVAQEGRANRESAAASAWSIVEEDVAAWRQARLQRDAVPALVALRRHFEAVRDEVLAAHPKAGPDEVARRLVNRLLHRPSEALRLDAAGDGDAEEARRVIARLFGLDPTGPQARRPTEPED